MKNIQTFKTLEDFLNEVQMESVVKFIFSQKLAYRSKKEIFINTKLSYDAKIFLIAHEFAHILKDKGNSTQISHFTLELEDADRNAFKMLKDISDNEDEAFSFENLYKLDIFNKLKDIKG